eukprot:gene32001-33928_t
MAQSLAEFEENKKLEEEAINNATVSALLEKYSASEILRQPPTPPPPTPQPPCPPQGSHADDSTPLPTLQSADAATAAQSEPVLRLERKT